MIRLIMAALVLAATQLCPPYPIGAPLIATMDFNPADGLRPSWGTGAIPASAGTDPLGAFRFDCKPGQVSYDDPVVYPRKPGASHLHQYYGNLDVDAYSTYATLRAHGDSTCSSDGNGHALNRSGYWMPAMLDGKGFVVEPDFVSIYYKRLPASNPLCGDPRINPKAQGICIPIPNGIRFIFGYDMLTNTAPTGSGQFMCDSGPSNRAIGTYANIADLAKAGCAAGNKIELLMSAPLCWDGDNLDSPNHRSHVAYFVTDRYTAFKHCPTDHPYLMPRFELGVFYTILPTDNLALWHLSSDEMRPGLPAGTTFHADYFEGWDPGIKAMWTDNCIDKHLNCSGGDLGNGLQLKGASAGPITPGKRIPVPARPGVTAPN